MYELKIEFKLNDMQLRAIIGIATGEDMVIIAPCGSGKILVFFLGIILLRDDSYYIF